MGRLGSPLELQVVFVLYSVRHSLPLCSAAKPKDVLPTLGKDVFFLLYVPGDPGNVVYSGDP